MRLGKVIVFCLIAFWGIMATSPQIYAQTDAQELIKREIIRSTEPKIEKRPQWLRDLVAGKKINYISDIEGSPKIKPDKQVHTIYSTIVKFDEKDNVIRLLCIDDPLNSNGILLDFGATGIKELDADLVEFIENAAQIGKQIYVIGTYDKNSQITAGPLKTTVPVLTVLLASTNNHFFKPKTYKAVGVDNPVQQVESNPTQNSPKRESIDSNGSGNIDEMQAKEVENAHKRINEIYKKVMAAIKDPQTKKKLRNEQRQWIKDRDKYCAPPKVPGLGTIWNIRERSCIVYWTEYRADQLDEMLGEYE